MYNTLHMNEQLSKLYFGTVKHCGAFSSSFSRLNRGVPKSSYSPAKSSREVALCRQSHFTNLIFRQECGQSDGAAPERGQDAEARGAARPRLDPRTRRGGRALQTEGFCDTSENMR